VTAEHVAWHDVECGSYRADLALWDELARRTGGPVLDVGAGTGRVALHLARAGHAVTALDRDPDLLAVLAERAGDLPVATVCADAAGFDAPGRFGLVAVPMQTIQILPGARERAGFFASARRALAPGGLVALAIADALDGFDTDADRPEPDVREVDGRRFVSQPTAVRPTADGVRIERLRRLEGAATAEQDVIVLARVSVASLSAEGAAAGLEPEPPRRVRATAEHVGSEVVLLRG
jgi:SAM-dependent methyltransferase